MRAQRRMVRRSRLKIAPTSAAESSGGMARPGTAAPGAASGPDAGVGAAVPEARHVADGAKPARPGDAGRWWIPVPVLERAGGCGDTA